MVLAPAPCVSWGGGGGGKEEDVEESRGLDVDYWAQSAIFAFALGDAVAIRVSCSSAVCALLVLWQFVAQYVRGPWIRFWVWIASHFHVRFSLGGGDDLEIFSAATLGRNLCSPAYCCSGGD